MHIVITYIEVHNNVNDEKCIANEINDFKPERIHPIWLKRQNYWDSERIPNRKNNYYVVPLFQPLVFRDKRFATLVHCLRFDFEFQNLTIVFNLIDVKAKFPLNLIIASEHKHFHVLNLFFFNRLLFKQTYWSLWPRFLPFKAQKLAVFILLMIFINGLLFVFFRHLFLCFLLL